MEIMIVADLSSSSLAGESAGKAMSRIYGNIGFAGLWNGLPVRIVMIGTLTVHAHSLHYPFPCRHQSLPKRDEMLIPNYRLSNGLSTTVSKSPWVCPRQVATRQKFVSWLSTYSKVITILDFFSHGAQSFLSNPYGRFPAITME